MIHVKTDEIYGKNPVTNAADYQFHTISIDTQFRPNQKEPSTDFQYHPAHPYKNVIRMRVTSVELPPVRYNLSQDKQNTMFRLDTMDYLGHPHFLTIQVEEGMYTSVHEIVEEIQRQFDAIRDRYGIFFRIVYAPLQQKVVIVHDGTAPPPCPKGPTHTPVVFGVTWMMVGQEDRRCDYGLGAILGFQKGFYVAEGPFEIRGEEVATLKKVDPYFLLRVNDCHAVEHLTGDGNYVQALAKILPCPAVAFSATSTSSSSCSCSSASSTILGDGVTWTKPIDVKHLRIQVLDVHGLPVNWNNWSFTLELTEIMHLHMYDHYRTYTWTGQEPRATEKTSGSSAGIAPPALNYN